MVLTKEELTGLLNGEIRILLHLISKIEPAMLDYRPAPKQRSLLELLQYLTFLGPVHLRGALAEEFDFEAFKRDWNEGFEGSKDLDLEGVRSALEKLPAVFTELLGACPDEALRAEHAMFGMKQVRGPWIVSLVLNHYVAYRMQVFLYLKGAGREELNTMNLWAGMDA